MAMTQEEFLAKLRTAFDNADSNKNGALEEAEAKVLAQKIAEHQGNEFDEAKFKENFDKADKNADGKLTFEEFSSKALAAAKEKGIVAWVNDFHNNRAKSTLFMLFWVKIFNLTFRVYLPRLWLVSRQTCNLCVLDIPFSYNVHL